MHKPEVIVIINSYNRLNLLKQSLDSLVKELPKTSIDFSIIVFEAGSTDGSIEWIQQFIAGSSLSIKLLVASKEEDNSFSYGVNAACNYALNHFENAKYFFLYETDNFLHSSRSIGYAYKLLEEENQLTACGFTVKKYDGSNAGFGSSFPSIGSFILGKQFSFFLKLEKPEVIWIRKDDLEFSYAEVVYTSPLLIRTETWKELQGFDTKNFPFSDCDIDLAFRIAKLNKKMAVLKTSEIIHDNVQSPSAWSDTRTIRDYKARFTYFKKHYGGIVHILKPFLFLTHVLEFILLGSLVLVGKRKARSLKTRWYLIKTVFTNYQ